MSPVAENVGNWCSENVIESTTNAAHAVSLLMRLLLLCKQAFSVDRFYIQ